MDSIDFSHHESFFEARKSGAKTAKKQKQHKNKASEVIT
jgi:hypothetical protein